MEFTVDLMDPPTLGRTDWESVARQVREHPGQWCRVPRSFNPSVAVHMRRGAYRYVPPEEFDITTRKDHSARNRSWIFLRTKHGG